jgi:hypothetical protein
MSNDNDSSSKAPLLEIVLFGGLAIILLSSMVRWDKDGKEGSLRWFWDNLWGRNQVAKNQTPPALENLANQPVTVPPAPNQTATTQPIAPVPVAPQTTIITPNAGGPADEVLPASPVVPASPVPMAGTHQVLCAPGYGGLNLRPQAGFSLPLFVMPCGAIVTVTGAPVTTQNETWSPVFYGNQNGWAATKLLQSIR